jgi:hypothetical protein
MECGRFSRIGIGAATEPTIFQLPRHIGWRTFLLKEQEASED